MSAPHNERRALERERAELPGRITAYWEELENGSPNRARRERLDWQIQRARKRLAAIEARLAGWP